MRIKYIINNDILTINFDFLYDFLENQNKIKNIQKYINNLIKNKKINFKGNRIVIYQNGLYIGTFYLVNYYLKKLNYQLNNISLNNNNSYFYESNIIELDKNHTIIKKISIY